MNIIQEPNIILNSADGKERKDKADKTETKYTLTYKGRQKSNTYPTLSTSSRTQIYDNRCGVYEYPQMWGTTAYAYNSTGGGCDDIYKCPPKSAPINFIVNTTLPAKAPQLLFTKNTKQYKLKPCYDYFTLDRNNRFLYFRENYTYNGVFVSNT